MNLLTSVALALKRYSSYFRDCRFPHTKLHYLGLILMDYCYYYHQCYYHVLLNSQVHLGLLYKGDGISSPQSIITAQSQHNENRKQKYKVTSGSLYLLLQTTSFFNPHPEGTLIVGILSHHSTSSSTSRISVAEVDTE